MDPMKNLVAGTRLRVVRTPPGASNFNGWRGNDGRMRLGEVLELSPKQHSDPRAFNFIDVRGLNVGCYWSMVEPYDDFDDSKAAMLTNLVAVMLSD